LWLFQKPRWRGKWGVQFNGSALCGFEFNGIELDDG